MRKKYKFQITKQDLNNSPIINQILNITTQIIEKVGIYDTINIFSKIGLKELSKHVENEISKWLGKKYIYPL